jgi:hypothetical protein
MRKFWVAGLCLPFAGCGGGGSGGDDGSWLTFTPSTVEVSAYQGDTPSFSVTATSSKTISSVVQLGIIDTVGVITPQVELVAESTLRYRVTLHLSPTLTAGTHTGSFEVRVCEDNPVTCAKPVAGSPWHVPYRITIQPGTNLTPLVPLAGAGAWSTFQGNSAHNGFVDATLNPTNFSRRWAVAGNFSDVAVDNGRIFSVSGGSSGSWTLKALNETDGSQAWAKDMGTLFRVNAPAAADGMVFATSTGHSDTAMWMFDAASGQQLARLPMSSQWETYLAPTVANGKVYTESGGFGGMSRFDIATLAQDWSVSLPQVDTWTPAVDAQYAYAYTGSMLKGLRLADGSEALSITDSNALPGGFSVRGAPALGSGGMVYATQFGSMGANGPDGRLVAFDTVAGNVKWSVSANVISNPVLVGNMVYAATVSGLQARSAADGSLLWTWTAPEGMHTLYGQTTGLLVVGQHAFVGTATSTHAVDLMSRQSVWRYGANGSLALSANGVLYLRPFAGTSLIAVNLH